jgi:hypothetical protein
MKQAIQRFNWALQEFKEATAALHPYVEEELAKRNTVDELQELIDILPKTYIGIRRIYEKIENLSN